MLKSKLLDDYRHLTQSSGFVVLPDRTMIRMQGADRRQFLHNFCTADVKALESGMATEALILNAKGKLLSHVYLMSGDNQLLLNTTGRQFNAIHDHLDKYIMREDVSLTDASASLTTMFVAGPDSEVKLRLLFGKVPDLNGFVSVPYGSAELGIAKVDLAGIGFLLTVPMDVVDDVERNLVDNGIADCSLESFHALRIKHKTPWFGIDASDDNLPQELRRDEQTICFTKGCYLGQETVARIDALGHVNQYLVGLKLDVEATPGTELSLDGKSMGRLTSVSWSPEQDAWIALGYVKRTASAAGTRLAFADGQATVV